MTGFKSQATQLLGKLLKVGDRRQDGNDKKSNVADEKKGAYLPLDSMPEMKSMSSMKTMSGKMAMRDFGDVPFQSGLVNGKGRADGPGSTPLTVIDVEQGQIIRFRLINGSTTYPLRFQVDGHMLTVIASDGSPIKPVDVDNLVVGIGERFDILLKADKAGLHWIRAVTLHGKEIRAILRYRGTVQAEPERSPVVWGPRSLRVEAMRSIEPAKLVNNPREIPLVLGGSMSPYRWSIDGQYYPRADPIVIKLNEPIRMIFRNPTDMDHPFHLHGHSFHVLGKPGALNLIDPVLKDTVNVPARGELAIQWVADNSGRWFFHCHIEWHMATGMARVIEIKKPS